MNRLIQAMTSPSKKCRESGDIISTLHGTVLSLILSRLPYKEAVRTSILSKDWRFGWTSLCNVNIDDDDKHHDELTGSIFANFVNRVLRCSNDMTSFSLATPWECYPIDCTTWVNNALSFKIERLELKIGIKPWYGDDRIFFFNDILDSTSLRILKLELPCTVDVNAEILFPNLTSLSLGRIRFVNGDSTTDTLSLICPVLETLETKYCKWVNVKSLEIHAPLLTTFSSNSTHGCGVGDYSVKIIGSKFAKFRTEGHIPERLILDGSQVVSAHICTDSKINMFCVLKDIGRQLRQLLNESSSSVEELELSAFVVKTSRLGEGRLQRFDKLRRLILSYWEADLVFELLHAAPSLKYLSIHVGNFGDYDVSSFVPPCIVSHLEEVKIYEFRSESNQTKLIKFLLENGEALRKLTFAGGHSETERSKIVEQLSKFHRRQSFLTVVFRDPGETIFVLD